MKFIKGIKIILRLILLTNIEVSVNIIEIPVWYIPKIRDICNNLTYPFMK